MLKARSTAGVVQRCSTLLLVERLLDSGRSSLKKSSSLENLDSGMAGTGCSCQT